MLTHVNIQYRVHISLNDRTDLHSFLYVCPSLPQTGSLLLEHLLNFVLLQLSINLSLCHTLQLVLKDHFKPLGALNLILLLSDDRLNLFQKGAAKEFL